MMTFKDYKVTCSFNALIRPRRSSLKVAASWASKSSGTSSESYSSRLLGDR